MGSGAEKEVDMAGTPLEAWGENVDTMVMYLLVSNLKPNAT
jgi:hypothetical protein